MVRGLTWRATPKRADPAAGNDAVQVRCDLKTIVDVPIIILKSNGKFAPEIPPCRTVIREPEGARETDRIPIREIKPNQYAAIQSDVVKQSVANVNDSGLTRSVVRLNIELLGRGQFADPRGVGNGARRVRSVGRTPINENVGVE